MTWKQMVASVRRESALRTNNYVSNSMDGKKWLSKSKSIALLWSDNRTMDITKRLRMWEKTDSKMIAKNISEIWIKGAFGSVPESCVRFLFTTIYWFPIFVAQEYWINVLQRPLLYSIRYFASFGHKLYSLFEYNNNNTWVRVFSSLSDGLCGEESVRPGKW